MELVCQQPHNQCSDQRSGNSQKHRICLDCSRQPPWPDNLFWALQCQMGICSGKAGPHSSKEHCSPRAAFSRQEERKMPPFYDHHVQLLWRFSIIFLLTPGAHIGVASMLSGWGIIEETHQCWRDSQSWQATHQPLEYNMHRKGGKYRDWW